MNATARDIATVLLEVGAEIGKLGERLEALFGGGEVPIDPESKLEKLAMDLAGIPLDTWEEGVAGEDGTGFSRDNWSMEIFKRQLEKQSAEEIWDWLVSEGAKLSEGDSMPPAALSFDMADEP